MTLSPVAVVISDRRASSPQLESQRRADRDMAYNREALSYLLRHYGLEVPPFPVTREEVRATKIVSEEPKPLGNFVEQVACQKQDEVLKMESSEENPKTDLYDDDSEISKQIGAKIQHNKDSLAPRETTKTLADPETSRNVNISLRETVEHLVSNPFQKAYDDSRASETPYTKRVCLKRFFVKKWFHRTRFKRGKKRDLSQILQLSSQTMSPKSLCGLREDILNLVEIKLAQENQNIRDWRSKLKQHFEQRHHQARKRGSMKNDPATSIKLSNGVERSFLFQLRYDSRSGDNAVRVSSGRDGTEEKLSTHLYLAERVREPGISVGTNNRGLLWKRDTESTRTRMINFSLLTHWRKLDLELNQLFLERGLQWVIRLVGNAKEWRMICGHHADHLEDKVSFRKGSNGMGRRGVSKAVRKKPGNVKDEFKKVKSSLSGDYRVTVALLWEVYGFGKANRYVRHFKLDHINSIDEGELVCFVGATKLLQAREFLVLNRETFSNAKGNSGFPSLKIDQGLLIIFDKKWRMHVRIWKSFCYWMEDHVNWFSCKNSGQNVAQSRLVNVMIGELVEHTRWKASDSYIIVICFELGVCKRQIETTRVKQNLRGCDEGFLLKFIQRREAIFGMFVAPYNNNESINEFRYNVRSCLVPNISVEDGQQAILCWVLIIFEWLMGVWHKNGGLVGDTEKKPRKRSVLFWSHLTNLLRETSYASSLLNHSQKHHDIKRRSNVKNDSEDDLVIIEDLFDNAHRLEYAAHNTVGVRSTTRHYVNRVTGFLIYGLFHSPRPPELGWNKVGSQHFGLSVAACPNRSRSYVDHVPRSTYPTEEFHVGASNLILFYLEDKIVLHGGSIDKHLIGPRSVSIGPFILSAF